VASWPEAGPGKDALLARADENLYIAKRRQRRHGAEESRAALPSTPEQVRLACASRLAAKLAPLLEPADIARTAVAEMHSTFGHFLAVIHRMDPDGKLRPVAAAGELVQQSPGFAGWEQPVQSGVNGRTARTGEPTLVADTRHYPDFIGAEGADESRSELALPIRVGGEIWGVLNLEDREPGHFGPDDILFGDTIASAVGAALHRARLFGELEGAFTRTLAVLSDALEAKDPYTAAHAREVAELSDQVGRRLGMAGPELRTLRYAALLHDIGKIGVRTELLRKEGPLTDEEFAEVKRHTVIGADMLARIPFFAAVHPLVRSAHERWDGNGYPDGLRGEAIPFGARVICACDALHAMTSHRSYRAAMSTERALDELAANAGGQFDPAVVEALLAACGASRDGHDQAVGNGVPRRRARDHALR
jgi:putative nucleotidyltransferase with HDIG domain